MKIAIASDHAGYTTKQALIEYLQKKGFEVKDFGTDSEESMDYPDVAHPLSLALSEGKHDLGITLCGSGNGINMTANKHSQIRSALCWLPEIAALAKQHNNANICAIPARFVSVQEAKDIVDAFLSAEFEGGRHQRRIDKIALSI